MGSLPTMFNTVLVINHSNERVNNYKYQSTPIIFDKFHVIKLLDTLRSLTRERKVKIQTNEIRNII